MPDDRFIHWRAGHSVKVAGLSDAAYRVWTQIILSADDFGVIRWSASKLQADNTCLERWSASKVLKAMNEVAAAGLLHTFTHQGTVYGYQRDWQTWQKVRYPRGTNQPAPSGDDLSACDAPTVDLFKSHPGGNYVKKGPKDSGNPAETLPQDSVSTRAGAPAKRLTANGQRLEANGERPTAGEADTPFTSPAEPPSHPFPRWLTEWHAAYPKSRQVSLRHVENAFTQAFFRHNVDPPELFGRMMTALEAHKASEEWQRGVIPGMAKWLNEDWWLRVLTPAKASGPQGKPQPDRMAFLKSQEVA